MNKESFSNTKLYQDPSQHKLSYSVARKEAFLAISNLNAAFSDWPKIQNQNKRVSTNLWNCDS
jgi:hypothetical protein